MVLTPSAWGALQLKGHSCWPLLTRRLLCQGKDTVNLLRALEFMRRGWRAQLRFIFGPECVRGGKYNPQAGDPTAIAKLAGEQPWTGSPGLPVQEDTYLHACRSPKLLCSARAGTAVIMRAGHAAPLIQPWQGFSTRQAHTFTLSHGCPGAKNDQGSTPVHTAARYTVEQRLGVLLAYSDDADETTGTQAS